MMAFALVSVGAAVDQTMKNGFTPLYEYIVAQKRCRFLTWPDARVVARVYVYQLDDKVGVGACGKWPLAFGLPVVCPEAVLGNDRFPQQNGAAPGRFGRFPARTHRWSRRAVMQ